jgi:hypothetical protein
MTNPPGPLKKGGYIGNQTRIVRFRASDGLHEQLQDLAHKQGICVAAVVRKLVLAGLEKLNN